MDVPLFPCKNRLVTKCHQNHNQPNPIKLYIIIQESKDGIGPALSMAGWFFNKHVYAAAASFTANSGRPFSTLNKGLETRDGWIQWTLVGTSGLGQTGKVVAGWRWVWYLV